MKRIPSAGLERLATVIRDLVYDTIVWAQLTWLTIDLDGTRTASEARRLRRLAV
jgi:hypothetical protein